MRRVALLAAAAAAGVLCAGCASAPKCREVGFTPGIYAGCKPDTPDDFQELRKQGIRTILSVESLPWHVRPECKQARANGIRFINVPILASFLEPNEKRVNQAVQVLADPALHPILVHCFLGMDRAAFVVGMYRMYYQHWTPEAAWQEMLRSGFHSSLRLRGFTTYFWSHTKTPAWAQQSEHPSQQDQTSASTPQLSGKSRGQAPK